MTSLDPLPPALPLTHDVTWSSNPSPPSASATTLLGNLVPAPPCSPPYAMSFVRTLLELSNSRYYGRKYDGIMRTMAKVQENDNIMITPCYWLFDKCYSADKNWNQSFEWKMRLICHVFPVTKEQVRKVYKVSSCAKNLIKYPRWSLHTSDGYNMKFCRVTGMTDWQAENGPILARLYRPGLCNLHTYALG